MKESMAFFPIWAPFTENICFSIFCLHPMSWMELPEPILGLEWTLVHASPFTSNHQQQPPTPREGGHI